MAKWIGRMAQALAFISVVCLGAAVALPKISDELHDIGLLALGVGVAGCVATIVIGHAIQLAGWGGMRSLTAISMRVPLITAYVAMAVFVLLSVGGEMPRLREPHQVAEITAIRSVRALVNAQAAYTARFPDTGFACNLKELGPPPSRSQSGKDAAGLIGDKLAGGSSRDYRYTVECRAGRRSYQVAAVAASNTGHRTYCADESGVIKVSEDEGAANCFIRGVMLR